jgi:hypothetical protein
MVDADHAAIILVLLVRPDHAQIGKSEAMMFIIECQKSKRRVR